MNNSLRLTVVTLLLAVSNLSAATLYVSLGSTNPVAPYATWDTAATNIQQAVRAAVAHDVVVVTNGVYPGGVEVTIPLTLRSVNGPQFTVINGGYSCASLTDGASLTGFTLTNGVVPLGGGVRCTSTNAFLTNCVITGNSALYNGDIGGWGGGACYGTLYNCTLSGNYAENGGGGARYSTLYNCTLTGNSSLNGGGALYCTLYNCALTFNSAQQGCGGGAYGCTLYNCTLSGNGAIAGGGVYGSTLYNCIVYFNTATTGANYDFSSPPEGSMNYCCTTPLPSGTGNIALDPQLASATHLSAGSPCRGAGSAAYATGTDIDGELWGNPPSIGCDEYHAGAVTGPLTVSIVANYTNTPVGYPVNLMALIEGRTTLSVWDFGDGMVVSNRPYATHSWAAPGDYEVVLQAYNESHLGGVSATLTIHVGAQQPVVYVAATSPNPLVPYASWSTAARNIQPAVDTAAAGGVVVVTNGVYHEGVAVERPLTLRSVNGPQFTVINGGGTNRCASLTNGASLSGFTLTNGWDTSGNGGGGVWCASTSASLTNCVIAFNVGGGAYGGTLYNCTLSGNSAGYGGGASACTLYNCTLSRNESSHLGGGGAYGCTLYNCTLTGNSVFYNGCDGGYGGGASACTLYNCIVYFNSAANGANYDSSCTLICCWTASDPLFVNYTGGNLRLQSNSPCINAGNNAYVTTATDLDGRPRIVGGTVDIGAYEFQSGVSGAFIGWLQQFGLPTDGSADYADPDHDGINNWQEWVCGTCPTNPLSALCVLSAAPQGTNVTVSWQSVAGVSYYLLRSTSLTSWPPFRLLATNLLGQAGTTSYTDTNGARLAPLFYRVGVGNYLVPTSPPRPTLLCQFTAASGTVQLTWSGTGFRLQSQTNGPGSDLTTNWFDYPGGPTSPVTVPVDPQKGAVFYRLVWP